jgi:hypothetical protein
MTDQSPAAPVATPIVAPALPSLAQQIVTALAQKGLTALATAMTGAGIIAPSQGAQVVSLGVAVVLWAASFVWTWARERHTRATLVRAINSPPPTVKVKA